MDLGEEKMRYCDISFRLPEELKKFDKCKCLTEQEKEEFVNLISEYARVGYKKEQKKKC
jgi:hypothetical protein